MSNVVTFFPAGSPVTTDSKDQHEAPRGDWRSRELVDRDIDRHIHARKQYAQAVAWIAAAESEKLPADNIEAAKQDLAQLHAEMYDCARMLLIAMPTDVKGLIELLLYMERNFTVQPQEITHAGGGTNPLALELLRTVRLSLRRIVNAQAHARGGNNMHDLIENRRVLRMQFEAFAHYARHESERPESASCFDALANSVDHVSPELLEAYVEVFQKIEHRQVGKALKQSIQQGLWWPTDATEYMERFISFASETGAPS